MKYTHWIDLFGILAVSGMLTLGWLIGRFLGSGLAGVAIVAVAIGWIGMEAAVEASKEEKDSE